MHFVLRRLLTAIPTLLGVVTLLFVIFSLLGDPAQQIAGQRADVATLDNIRTELGLDQPLWKQYLLYLNDLSPIGWLSDKQQASGNYSYLNIGGGICLKAPYLKRSFQNGRPILGLYLERLPGTALLALSALAIAALLGVTLGSVAGTHPHTRLDRGLSLISMVGISAPSFFVAVVFIWLFSALLGWLPSSGFVREPAVYSMGYTWHWSHMVLPAVTLGIRPLAILFQISRDSMIETMRQPYIRTAYAKGVPHHLVILRHALPNSLNPVVTSISGWLASLLAGTFFIEYIFNWQGIGKLTIDALLTNDYPMLLGSALCTAVIFILVNIFVDIAYKRLDPRVRLS